MYDGGPMLRAHAVRTLDDRVRLLRRLVWLGDAGVNRGAPEVGGLKDPRMRQIGLAVTQACVARDDTCELDAIYRFVKANVRYTGDITMKDTFQTAYRTLQMGGGDCFPEGTTFLTPRRFRTVEQIEIGDVVHDGERFVPVLKTWVRGPKRIISVTFHDRPTVLRLSESHLVLRVPHGGRYGDAEEVRMCDLRIGDTLLRPNPEVLNNGPYGWAKVRSITAEPQQVDSYDIMTASGRVYLPEADVITRQCDDHSVLCAVLAMENGFQTKFRITSNTGATWDHIFCMAAVPKTSARSWVALDTTLPRGSLGTLPPWAKFRDFDVDEP